MNKVNFIKKINDVCNTMEKLNKGSKEKEKICD